MSRRIVDVFGLAACLALFWLLYDVRYAVEGELRALKRIESGIRSEIELKTVLQAEWSSLNDPRRLQILARRHLDLHRTRPSQIVDARRVSKSSPPTPSSASFDGP